MQVEHPNIVKFHKYWLDMKESQARVRFSTCLLFFTHTNAGAWTGFLSSVCGTQVIFITEYMSSGSLKQFLKKTKKNHKTMNVKVSVLLWSHTESHGGSSGYCSPIAIQIHFSSRIRDYVTRHRSVCSDMHLILTWWISNIHEVYSQYLPSLK